MSLPLRLFFDHQLVREHPPGSQYHFESGDLVVLEPSGEEFRYPAGSIHGGGFGATCSGEVRRADCPGCWGIEPT